MTLRPNEWYRGRFGYELRWLFIERIDLRGDDRYTVTYRVCRSRCSRWIRALCLRSENNARDFVAILDRATQEDKRNSVVKTVPELEVRYR